MQTSTITHKGQITIPAALRKQLGLQPGDQVAFHTHNHEIILTKQKNDITASFGILRVNKKISQDDIDAAIKQGPLDDQH